MTGAQVVLVRGVYGLSKEELASVLGCSLTSVYRWEEADRHTIALRFFPQVIMQLLLETSEESLGMTRESFGRLLVERARVHGFLAALYEILKVKYALLEGVRVDIAQAPGALPGVPSSALRNHAERVLPRHPCFLQGRRGRRSARPPAEALDATHGLVGDPP